MVFRAGYPWRAGVGIFGLNSDVCDRGGCGASDGGNRDLFDEELILDPNLAAATPLDIDIEPSNYNNCTLSNCSMNCPSHAIDFMGSAALDEGPVFDEEPDREEEEPVSGDLTTSCTGFGFNDEPVLDEELFHGTAIYDEESAFSRDLLVGTTLVLMYSKAGSLPDAHRVFDEMLKRSIISYNALLFGYAPPL
jgi:pentatricopeptide repeat protein